MLIHRANKTDCALIKLQGLVQPCLLERVWSVGRTENFISLSPFHSLGTKTWLYYRGSKYITEGRKNW